MIDPATLHGSRLAMIAWGKKPDGADDVAVFSGTAEWDGARLTMRRSPETASFVIPDRWLTRLKPVEAHLKTTLLDADYCFSVSIGTIGADEDVSAFHDTGLKWPPGPRAAP